MEEHAGNDNQLKAGVASIDISPKPGVSLGGYPHHPRPNEGVHDPLYATCLYLDDGETRIAMVGMDLLMISKRNVRTIREAVERETGIPAGNITICCSHTHSSPRASASFTMDAIERGQDPDTEFVPELTEKLTGVIVQAASDPFEAKIGVERGYCGREEGVGGNRRHPKGTADPEVWTIGVQDAQGVWRAIVVKYALHPTFLHSDNFLVSADYVGYLRSTLAERKPGAKLLFLQGTSGNQSSRYFRSGKTFAEAERVGSAIGRAADQVLDNMELRPSAKLRVDSVETEIDLRELPPRSVSEEETRKAKAEWDGLQASGAPERDVWNAELRFLGAEDTLSLVMLRESGEIRIVQEDFPPEVQVIGIDDARIVFFPGELFVELGLTVQYRAPFTKCFAVELANGVLPGYAATEQAYAEGGYETGASMLTGRSGEQLVDAAVKLLRSERD